jgi:hypothetical protein
MSKRRLWTLIAAPGLALTSLLLVFLLLGRSTAGAIPEVRSPEATFTVSGTVSNAAAEPISDVVVYAWKRYEGSGLVGDVTDSSGYYSVTLDGGNYELNFTPACGSGYASKSYKGITGPPDQTLNVVLSSGHTVSGTVFATDGSTPVGDVTIYAFNRHTADGFGLPPTDDQGTYCVGLVTGTYGLSFTPPPCLGLGPHTEEITITCDTPLSVTLPPGFTVAGCVADESGEPVPGVQVYAEDPNIRGFGFAPTDGSGCYTGTLPFTGTPPTGVYDVQFIPPPGLGLGSVTVTDVVSTTAGCPNATLPITLPAGYTLSGRVTCNGVGIKNAFVYALSKGPHDPRNSLPGYGVFTVDDGSYGLPLVPDTYRVEFTPPEAAGLNAKAFTTIELITDTVLDVEFCLCRGAWVTETVDSAGDVGSWNSLALGLTYPYVPHISYHDVTSDNLKYAWLSGTTWLSETVDSGGSSPSLALVPAYPYSPCVSYNARDYVYLACRKGITWTVEVVPYSADGCCPSLALEPLYPYRPHIGHHAGWSRTQHHAYLSGTTWFSGTWVWEWVEPPFSEMGSFSSLALEPTGPYTPHTSYRDFLNRDLKYAWKSDTTWLSETVDSEGDVGLFSSLALDSSAHPHVSYFDRTNSALKYAWLSGTTWISETVDRLGGMPEWWRGSLALNQADAPHISYHEATSGDLKLARRDGTVWIVQTVDSGGDVGEFSSLALDAVGCPHISYYDATDGDLRYARIPAVYYVHLPIIMRDYR